jgi:hypothetical protein
MEPVVGLPTVEALREYVLQTLCAHERLDPSQTPLHEAAVTRAKRTCGLFFQVQGPRLVRAYAVWAGEEDRILFYDSGGARFAEARLSEAPDPRKLSEQKPVSRRAA